MRSPYSSSIRNALLVSLFGGSFALFAAGTVSTKARLTDFKSASRWNGSGTTGSSSIDLSAPQSSVAPTSFSSLAGNAEEFFKPISAVVQTAFAPASDWIRHKITRGDTLDRIWDQYGASKESAASAEQALKDLGANTAKLRHGEEIELEVTADGQISGLKKRNSDGSLVVLEKDDDSDGYTSHVEPLHIVEKTRTASGIILSSMSAAAQKASVPYSVIDEYVDLFSARVEFQRALRAGDTFTVQYSEKRDENGDLISTGPITSASLKTGGKMLVALRHVGSDGKARFYDEEGNALGNYFLRYPLQFTRISSVFSTARFHPILNVWRPHNGVDFAAPTGTPVRTVAEGVVEFAGFTNDTGNMIKIRHGDRWSTAYLHLSKISPNVRTGSHVSRGDVIGAVGMTGLATAPHLHFSLYDHDKYVNPLTTDLPQMQSIEAIPRQYLLTALQTLRTEHVQLEHSQIAQNSESEHRHNA